MKLAVINPVVNLPQNVSDAMKPYLASLTRTDTEIEYVTLKHGFPSVESDMQGMFNGTEIVREALAAAQRGADGIFVNCFDDPGVQALREMIEVPVFGGYVPSVLTALSLGGRIGIITTDYDGIANEERKARTEGFDGKIAAIIPADMMVGEVFGGDGVDERLADVCSRMHDEYRINTVILGCTGMQRAVAKLRKRLADAHYPVTVVEPLAAGVTHLERMVTLGMTNSLHIGITLEGLVD